MLERLQVTGTVTLFRLQFQHQESLGSGRILGPELVYPTLVGTVRTPQVAVYAANQITLLVRNFTEV